LVDDGDLRGGGAIAGVEVAAGDDGQLERGEEMRVDRVDRDRGACAAGEGDIAGPTAAGQELDAGIAGLFHARDGGEPGGDAVVEGGRLIERRAVGDGVDLELEQALAGETHLGGLEIMQRADEQAGADQQDEREGDLNRHQGFGEGGAPAGAEVAGAALKLGAEV